MKKMILKFLLISVLAFNITPAIAQETTDISKLILEAASFDQKNVKIEGEAIGDAMKRGNGTWVNVLEGGVAMGVWTTSNIKENLTYLGDYKAKGDDLRVTGIFNRICKEHGGDMDIHAEKITIIKKGHSVKHPISRVRLQAAILLTLGAMLAFGFNLSRAKRYL